MKRSGKKLLSLALAMCVVLALLPTQAFAASSAHILNITDLENADSIESPTKVGTNVFFTINPGASIDANGKKADEFTFTKRLKLPDTSSVSFTVSSPVSVTVYAMSASASDERSLVLYKGTQTVGSAAASGDSLTKLTYSITETGTYDLKSESGQINIYYISVSETEITLDSTTNKYLYIFDTGYILSGTSIPSPTTSHEDFTVHNGDYILSGGTSSSPVAAFVKIMGDYNGFAGEEGAVSKSIYLDGLCLSSDAPFALDPTDTGARVNLVLKEGSENKLSSGTAGLNVPEDTTLAINADGAGVTLGKLTAFGGECNAGIGGNNNQTAGTITINSGRINATSDTGGAGIGGGNGSAGGTITINGGIIHAGCPTGGNGIGGGDRGVGGTIIINGGTITGGSGTRPVALGNGDDGTGVTITITGGSIVASESGSGPVCVSPQPKNGATTPVDVYRVALTLSGANPGATITGSSGIGNYGLNDVYADKVYLWLPAAESLTLSLTTGTGDSAVTYSGTVKIEANNNNAHTLTAKTPLSDSMIQTIDAQTHTGSQITPEIVVKDGDTTLTLGTDYTVSYGENTAVGADSGSVTITGIGKYVGSVTVTFEIKSAGGKNPGGGGGGSTTPTPSPGDSLVIVDGKPVDAGTVTVDKGETTTVVDQDVIVGQIESAESTVTVLVPTAEDSTTATAQLVVKNIDDMAEKEITLTVEADGVTYQLPTNAVDTLGIMAQLGADDPAQVPLTISITTTVDEVTQALVNEAMAELEGALVFPPMQFTITASYGGQTVDVTRFAAYVSRIMEIPEEQAAKITTAIVVEADGTVRHVPTKVYKKGGKWYAEINSLTNSTYALIYNESSFPDIAGKWFEAYAQEAGNRKIVNGYPDGTFAGDASITRAEFAQILVNALGLPANGNGTVFADVDANAWYCGVVGTAYEYGLVSGRGNGVFDPQASITRQEAMQMIRNAAKIASFTGQSDNLDSFTDAAQVAGWAEDAVKFCVGSGLVVGSDGKVMPTDSISRAETATIVLRLLQEAGLVDVRS